MFEKLTDPQVRNTLTTDILSLSAPDIEDDIDCPENIPSTCDIPPDLHLALSFHFQVTFSRRAEFLSHFVINGLTYAVSSKHIGNSSVLIGTGPLLSPARIDYIIRAGVDTPKSLFAVRRFKRAQVTNDPFKLYPVLQASMWSTECEDLEIITPDHIKCHFAHCLVRWEELEVLVAISLLRECTY
jgi:hypothetical protein